MEAPPAAPPAPPSPSKAAAPAAKPEIKVSEMAKARPLPMRDKGPARAALFEELNKRAGKEPAPEKTDEKPTEKAPEKAEIPKKAEAPGDEPDELEDSPEKPQKPEAAKPEVGKDGKEKKVSPWKLIEEYKQKLAKAESEKLETEKRAVPADKWKEKEAALEASQKRLTELEEEIRFSNYKKSKPYQEMQDKYKGAWTKAMSTLSEITLQGENGERAMTPNDLLELVNLSDVQAKRAAIDKYGDLEGLVMQHRDKIRDLADQQATEEEKARSEGAMREKTKLEEVQKKYTEVTSEIKDTYTKANQQASDDPKNGKYFKPIEGDQDWNQRLAKGFELVDRGFNESPLQDGISPEERRARVERHVAIRNRAAAFGPLKSQNQKLEAKIAEMQKVLDEFKGSEPKRGGSLPETQPQKRAGMTSLLEELRKKAKN